jgi:hypothetical protein
LRPVIAPAGNSATRNLETFQTFPIFVTYFFSFGKTDFIYVALKTIFTRLFISWVLPVCSKSIHTGLAVAGFATNA